MNSNPSDPFIGVQMHDNRTPSGRQTSTSAKQTAVYFAYGRDKQAQLDGKQRGEWMGSNGRIHPHESVMEWVKQEAPQYRYTFQAILSVPYGELTSEQFCQAMGQSDEITDWRLMMHQDSEHSHAHVLFFRNKRLDKKSFLGWQTAVREELSRLEQQQLATPRTASLENQGVQLEMSFPTDPKRAQYQEEGLG